MNKLNEIGFTDDSVSELVTKLNWTYTQDVLQWSYSSVQKEYTGLFGDTIKAQEKYYRLRNGLQDIILSEASMEKLLLIQFITHPGWDKQADRNMSQETDKIRDIMNGIRGKQADR